MATTLTLAHPPIVEAVLDIDCDMQPDFDLTSSGEQARTAFRENYPTVQVRHFHEHRIEDVAGAEPKVSTKEGLQAYLFLSPDGKQLVQVRPLGFTFNRLAPYSTLDDYLPEIERAWSVFVAIARPRQVRAVKLRYINRIQLPLVEGSVKLHDYLKVQVGLPDETGLSVVGFLNRVSSIDTKTGVTATTTLAADAPEESKLPIILDIETARSQALEVGDWKEVLSTIQTLRDLKNQIFDSTLDRKCLELFQ